MPRTISVDLTRKDLQVLRRLIVDEARRLDPDRMRDVSPQRLWPSKLRRIMPVARKIWHARQAIDGKS